MIAPTARKFFKYALGNTSGFSLVEMVLVVMIVGFIVMLIANVPQSLSLIGKSKFASTANSIASNQLEAERALTYDNLADGSSPVLDIELSSLPSGAGTTTVSDCPASICKNGEQVKQVVVVVNWIEGSTPKNVTLTTMVAKGGLH